MKEKNIKSDCKLIHELKSRFRKPKFLKMLLFSAFGVKNAKLQTEKTIFSTARKT